MFCGECGTKNVKDALFCENCGKQLKTKNYGFKKNLKKHIDKKTKIKIGIVALLVLIIGSTCSILSMITSPKNVAKNYVEATLNHDVEKLYNYLDLSGDKTFISKKIFRELLQTDELPKIENYKVSNIHYGASKLTASVNVVYTKKGSSTEDSMNVSLVKQKRKKWLFFDHWKVSFSESSRMVVEDFKVVVPKDAKLTYAGVLVEKKYLDKELSTDTTDVYILKQVFSVTTNIKVELPSGYQIDDQVTPSAYKNTYTAKVSLSSFQKEEQEKITEIVMKDLTALYQGAISGKSFQEIQKNVSVNQDQWKDVEKQYITFVEDLKKAYNKLTAIEFTKITLSDVNLNDKGDLEFKLKVNYKYSIQYTDYSDQVKTKDSSSYSYMELAYSARNKTYYIVDIKDLENYFSRY